MAKNDSPKKQMASVAPMITSALRAFFHSGLWNAVTPLEMASTPVTAEPPDANACSTTHRPAP